MKEQVALFVAEAVQAGARKKAACSMIGITLRTLENWNKQGFTDRRKGASKSIPQKLSDEERKTILEACNSDRFKDMTPHEIVAILAQEGVYHASESTFYRILKEERMLHHRSDSKPRKKSVAPPTLMATGPNQVWCWDITWLPLTVRGRFVFAYMIIDIYDRSIVGWEIHMTEDASLARELFSRLSKKLQLKGVHLHADNGNPMKGLTLLALLYFLGVRYSFSRPRVSNDNPFIESFFKTLKYTAGYPGAFRNIEHAREWMAGFVHWYNHEHLHSALGYVSPIAKRAGHDIELFAKRNQTIEAARELNPERWGSRATRTWTPQGEVLLNPGKKIRENQNPAEKKTA